MVCFGKLVHALQCASAWMWLWWAACRGVQNMLIGSGTGKVQSVVEICDRLLAEFDGVTRSKTRPTILVMGPWTGPRSKEDFVVAAKLLDVALVDRIAREEGINYMSMIFRRLKPTKQDWQIQSSKDKVSMQAATLFTSSS